MGATPVMWNDVEWLDSGEGPSSPRVRDISRPFAGSGRAEEPLVHRARAAPRARAVWRRLRTGSARTVPGCLSSRCATGPRIGRAGTS